MNDLLFPINIFTFNLIAESAVVGKLTNIDRTTEWSIPFYFFDGHLEQQIKLSGLWFSIYNHRYYYLNTNLSFEPFDINEYVVILGFFPTGLLTIWIVCDVKSKIIFSHKSHDITEQIIELVKSEGRVIDVGSEILEIPFLFDNYMKQFTYRYQMEFERWDEANGDWTKYEEEEMSMMPEFDYIEEALFDGTHDKLHDGGLMKYHEAGKPKKLAVQWHVNKSEWSAYFWFEDEVIRAIFDRFYGAHRDTKTDFILRFDPYNNKYELSLYRYGLREPLLISEKAYQLLVFKNKFECFRSNNYAQERGAWIW